MRNSLCLSLPRALVQCSLIFLALGFVPPEAFAFSYDEGDATDLSDDRLNPTILALSIGTNSLNATTGLLPDFTLDVEYVRLDLSPNTRLDQIIMRSFEAQFDGLAFIAVQQGTTFTVPPGQAGSDIDQILGYAHFGPYGESVVGEDILDDIGRGFGAIGFSGPLEGSSYTFWIQQTGSLTTYQLDFMVSAVPEPASAALLACLMTGMLLIRRRRNEP